MTEPPASAYKLVPKELKGDVWVDEFTAVRLLNVSGTLERNTYSKESTLKILREINPEIDLQFPKEIVAK